MTGTQIMVTIIFVSLFVCVTISDVVKAKYGITKKRDPE